MDISTDTEHNINKAKFGMASLRGETSDGGDDVYDEIKDIKPISKRGFILDSIGWLLVLCFLFSLGMAFSYCINSSCSGQGGIVFVYPFAASLTVLPLGLVILIISMFLRKIDDLDNLTDETKKTTKFRKGVNYLILTLALLNLLYILSLFN